MRPLVDKFIDARNDMDNVSVIQIQARPPVQVQTEDDTRTPPPKKQKRSKIVPPKCDIVKTESESDSERDGLFRRKEAARVPQVLPKCFQGFSSIMNFSIIGTPGDQQKTPRKSAFKQIVPVTATNVPGEAILPAKKI